MTPITTITATSIKPCKQRDFNLSLTKIIYWEQVLNKCPAGHQRVLCAIHCGTYDPLEPSGGVCISMLNYCISTLYCPKVNNKICLLVSLMGPTNKLYNLTFLVYFTFLRDTCSYSHNMCI